MGRYETIYQKSPLFKLYVDRYCKERKVSFEEAMSHKIVQLVGDRYNEGEVRNDGSEDAEVHRYGC